MSNNHKIIQLENRVKELENVVEQYKRILYPLFGVKKCKKKDIKTNKKLESIISKIRTSITSNNRNIEKRGKGE